jgi:hypothetical protein
VEEGAEEEEGEGDEELISNMSITASATVLVSRITTSCTGAIHKQMAGVSYDDYDEKPVWPT